MYIVQAHACLLVIHKSSQGLMLVYLVVPKVSIKHVEVFYDML